VPAGRCLSRQVVSGACCGAPRPQGTYLKKAVKSRSQAAWIHPMEGGVSPGTSSQSPCPANTGIVPTEPGTYFDREAAGLRILTRTTSRVKSLNPSGRRFDTGRLGNTMSTMPRLESYLATEDEDSVFPSLGARGAVGSTGCIGRARTLHSEVCRGGAQQNHVTERPPGYHESCSRHPSEPGGMRSHPKRGNRCSDSLAVFGTPKLAKSASIFGLPIQSASDKQHSPFRRES